MGSAAQSADVRTSVLIAGGGPVGLTLSMSLARRGIACIVLEARDTIPPNPRCNTTNARSMEIFRLLGCADAIRAAGLHADHSTDVVYMTDLAGAELTRFSRPTSQAVISGHPEGIGASWPTPEPQHFISQLYLEPVLRHHAADNLGVDLRLGWRLVELAETEDGVLTVAEHGEGGPRISIAADYIVGADGSSSIVRRTIGASLEGLPELENTTSIFFRSARVDELFERTPGWMYRFPGGAMLVAISEHEWLIHTQVPRGQDPATFDYEPQMFASLGERVDYEVIGVSRWTARAMVSNKFVEGRALLAGDAAHIWVPMGGFGMNAGVGDADALGWRLAGVIQGWLDPKILHSYETERSSLGVKVASQAPRWRAAIAPLMQAEPSVWAALREEGASAGRAELGARIQSANLSEWESVGLQLGFAYEDSPIIVADSDGPPPFSVDDYVESSAPGVRAPHIWRDNPHRSLYDDFGIGFTLVRLGSNPPSSASLVDEAAKRGIPLAVVDVPEAEAWMKYEEFELVLVRPDQYIAWRSHLAPADAGTIFDTLTGRALAESAIQEHVAQPVSSSEPAVRASVSDSVAALAVSPSGNKLYLGDGSGAVRQARVKPDGSLGEFYPFVPPSSAVVTGIAVDASGMVWICRPEERAIAGYDPAGRLRDRISTPAGASSIAVATDRGLLVIVGSEAGRSWIAEHQLPQREDGLSH